MLIVLYIYSGGIDSTVTAVLLSKVVPKKKLHCIFIDTGLLLKHEKSQIIQLYKELDIPLMVQDDSDYFLELLKGVTDPEQKRKIIGDSFFRAFKAQKNGARYLAQGTIYPDRIESGQNSNSDVIKSHHNVVKDTQAFEQSMGLKLIEPLRDLYKDQVRQLAQELNIPECVVKKQPFPGPGLAIRIVGEVTQQKLDIVRNADEILQLEIKQSKYYNKIWQSYVALLSTCKTVGVKGDSRAYEWPLVIRIVHSNDAMTADILPIEWDILQRVTQKILNSVTGCNRVFYDLTSKPPGTIELE